MRYAKERPGPEKEASQPRFSPPRAKRRSVFERAADQTVSRASNPQYRVSHKVRKDHLLTFHKMFYFSIFFSY